MHPLEEGYMEVMDAEPPEEGQLTSAAHSSTSPGIPQAGACSLASQRNVRSTNSSHRERTMTRKPKATKPEEMPKKMPVGLSPYDAANQLCAWTISANGYARTRKARFRALSSGTKVLSLVLSGSATIILGLQNLSFWAGLGFSLVALLTVVNAVEPFFNWRSRWILAEEAQHRFYRLEEDLKNEVAATKEDDLKFEDLTKYYERYKYTWNDFAKKWLVYRRQPSQEG